MQLCPLLIHSFGGSSFSVDTTGMRLCSPRLRYILLLFQLSDADIAVRQVSGDSSGRQRRLNPRAFKKTKPTCVPDEYWAAWQTEWDNTEFKSKLAKYRANRLSEPEGTCTGISKHIGGSRSTIDHAIDINKKTGREATKYEIFNRLHQKSDNAFTTQKAANTAAEIESALDEVRTSTQSEPDVD